ncbi:MAG: glycosyltransferase [Chloroflexi bacterium]|nr:glycosyltransferase [Chloroflexota bacterium]
MTSSLIGFFVFWGIWLFIPLMVDGVTAVAYLIGGFWMNHSRHRERQQHVMSSFPKVSIIVPVFNGEAVVGACLDAIMAQNYPHEKLEVIVVDNLSDDLTLQVVHQRQQADFAGSFQYFSVPFKGKSWALNAGIYRTTGDIICNLDADVQLHPDAIRAMAQAFDYDPTLAAVTGSIEVRQLSPEERSSTWRFLLGECEFLEYYAGFRIGRQYQSLTNSLFTLAGAFSGFRKEVILRTTLYQSQTVSEDTQLTFEIHQNFPDMRLQCLPDAIAYVDPTTSLSSLYAQRVRWQRGQLEVASIFSGFLKVPKGLRGLSIPRTLVVDHTLAFPRIVWTFLMPMLYFFGYPLDVVVTATLSMYLVYLVVDGMYTLATYFLADQGARIRIRKNWWVFTILPAFRWMVFWFRFAGFLSALKDPPEWRVQDPVQQTIIGLKHAKTSTIVILSHLSKLQVRLIMVELLRMFRP